MKVVFLDVCGVLYNCYTKELTPNKMCGVDNSLVKRFSEIVKELDLTIVLIGSFGRDNLTEQEYLQEKMAKYGIEFTDTAYSEWLEKYEIGVRNYLSKHDVESYVILYSNYGGPLDKYENELEYHLVNVSRLTGLTDADVDKIKEIINGRLAVPADTDDKKEIKKETVKGETKMAEQKKIKPMTIAECQVETIKHIDRVRYYIRIFTDKLTTRGVEHDKTKLESPEVELFAEHTPKLASLTYGTEEYQQSLDELNIALQHHYAQHRHHPEHFKRGINDMNLVDIVEFFCDIKAASERQHDGNLLKSIESCAERFGIDDQLKQILINTAKMIDEQG